MKLEEVTRRTAPLVLNRMKAQQLLYFSLKMINLTRTDDVGISEMTKMTQRCSLCVTLKINQIFDLKQVFSSICQGAMYNTLTSILSV